MLRQRLFDWICEKFPQFAFGLASMKMYEVAQRVNGMSKHFLCIPPAHALCIVNPRGQVLPFLRVYGVLRPVADSKTEIAEDPGDRLVFFTTEAAADQEAERRGIGWSSYEFWLDTPETHAC